MKQIVALSYDLKYNSVSITDPPPTHSVCPFVRKPVRSTCIMFRIYILRIMVRICILRIMFRICILRIMVRIYILRIMSLYLLTYIVMKVIIWIFLICNISISHIFIHSVTHSLTHSHSQNYFENQNFL